MHKRTQRHVPVNIAHCILPTAHRTSNTVVYSKCIRNNNIPDAVINQILAHLCNLIFYKMFSIWHSVWSGRVGRCSFIFAFNISAFSVFIFNIQHHTVFVFCSWFGLYNLALYCKFKFLFYWPTYIFMGIIC